jgi:hypothetical protein
MFRLRYLPKREGMHKLIYFRFRHVLLVVSGNMGFKFFKCPSDVSCVHKTKLLMDVLGLRGVYEKMVESVLIKSGHIGSLSDVRGHLVRHHHPGHCQVLSQYFRKRGVLSVWDVVLNRDPCFAAEHPEHSINFTSKYLSVAQMLAA